MSMFKNKDKMADFSTYTMIIYDQFTTNSLKYISYRITNINT